MTWTNGAYAMDGITLRTIGIVNERNSEQCDRDHDAALRMEVVTDTQNERRERNKHDHQCGISAIARNGFVRFFAQLNLFLFRNALMLGAMMLRMRMMFVFFIHKDSIPSLKRNEQHCLDLRKNTQCLRSEVAQYNKADDDAIHAEDREVVLFDVTHQEANGDHTHSECREHTHH